MTRKLKQIQKMGFSLHFAHLRLYVYSEKYVTSQKENSLQIKNKVYESQLC